MDKHQFAVLYHEFLFRMVDRDLLSAHAQGDISKLLGRLAAILVWISIPFAGMAMVVAQGAVIRPVHGLIATTMLIVSVLCVLSWDSLFPDRRDVFVLMPLGVKASTIFAAKIASIFAAVATSVAVFHALPGLLFPFALVPSGRNVLEILFSVHLYRAILAYWPTMFLAGVFVFLTVASVQAAASQLPRALALRASSILQITTFGVAVGVYFLQPSLASMRQLALPVNQGTIAWLPSYWFLGLFHQLSGMPGDGAGGALTDLAKRAWMGLGVSGAAMTAAVLVSCLGALRKIAEQPDIVSVHRKRGRSMPPGDSPLAAILQWTVRTLIRSRQHRVLVTFYAGIGFAAVILFLQAPRVQVMSRATAADPWQELSLPLIAGSLVMTVCWITGIRAAFAIPVEVRANWIFRLSLTSGPAEALAATRVSLMTTGIAPVCVAAAILFIGLWPADKAGQHLLVMALTGSTLTAVCLRGFHKIPFTCAYLPGASQLHITMALCVMLGLNVVFWSARFEREALSDPTLYFQTTAALAGTAAVFWWRVITDHPRSGLLFDETPAPAVLTLGLEPDGYSARR